MKNPKKVVLVITDGIGYNKDEEFNAIYHAKTPNFDALLKDSAHSLIKTSGLSVGLPDGQMGNSEVGHMCIGSGRVIYQNLVKIDNAIKDGSLKENETLINFINRHDRIHIIGLFSDGGVHSHFRHFNEIFDIANRIKDGDEISNFNKSDISDNNMKVFSHIITDGRDVDPKSSIDFIKFAKNIATISGRYYAMDRDKRFDRIKLAYDIIKDGKNLSNLSPIDYIKNSYDNGIFDEFILPASFMEFGGIKKSDGIICINFRNDRMKEIVSALSMKNFIEFDTSYTNDVLTMTNYDDTFDCEILFDNKKIKNTLAEAISNANLTQAHIAETEKYAHVTFFLNGGEEVPFLNESRILVPSPKISTYDKCPQMSAYEVKDMVIKAINANIDFVVVNFANGDMVGHTGDFKASIKAVEVVDECIGEILKIAKDKGYTYIQTSDHGNCEQMQKDGKITTNHTTFDVFCYVVDDEISEISDGSLANIAPTILKIMGLKIPDEMEQPLF